jgi:hypothetical protein
MLTTKTARFRGHVLAGHLGRPKGLNPKMSRVKDILVPGHCGTFVPDCPACPAMPLKPGA